MDGEHTTQTAGATDTAAAAPAEAATPAAGATGAVPGGGRRQQFAAIPELGPGKENDPGWVTYLQELLNFYYQMQVVDQNGHFDHATENVVSHLRDFIGIGPGHVDLQVWQALGAESPAGTDSNSSSSSAGGTVHEQDHTVQIVDTQGEAGWAAAMAIVLNAKAGGNYTTESLCQQANVSTSDRKGWQDVVSIARETFRMVPVDCHGGTAAGWSTALQNSPLVVVNPRDEHNVFVVAGVKADGSLHVLDPSNNNYDNWMTFATFTEHYDINDGYNAELLGV